MCDDHIDPKANQISEQSRKTIVLAISPAGFDHKILPLPIAELTKARAKGLEAFAQTFGSTQTQEPDPKDLRRLLLRECHAQARD
jgi:hypothetical protein